MLRRTAAVLALALAGGSAAAAPQGRGFDGVWNVLIITDKGVCDRGYRYNLRIVGGAVSYEGDGSGIAVDVSGRVTSGGRIRVSLSRGSQQARGSGRLAESRGTGTWSGTSPGAQCSGRWEAEKRGT